MSADNAHHHERLREVLSSPVAAATDLGRARRLGVLVALFSAALAVFAVSPASAVNQQVQVSDNAFTLPGVAVKPGETVTWNNPTTNDIHNVTFEDGPPFASPSRPERGPWTAGPLTFSTEGTFRYFCQEHGNFGGQGMSGIVYVNATGTVPGVAPTASFTASPGTARVGQVISFNATSTDPDPNDSIIRHEWDFDGNGLYETDTGAVASTSMAYITSGVRTVKLRVTDIQRHTNETTRTVTVTDQPVAPPTQPPPTQPPAQPPANPTPPQSQPPSPTPRPVACSTLKGARRTACVQKRCRTLKGGKRATCISRSCRYLPRGKRAACMLKSCRFLTGTKKRACVRKHGRKR